MQKKEVSSVDVTPAECRLGTHAFRDSILDKTIHFHVIKMADSFMVWIGSQVAMLDSLAVAMNTSVDKEPSAASLIGSSIDLRSSVLAKKLAKSTGKQVFVSYNFSDDQSLMSLVEKRLIQEMKEHPEKF